MKECLYFSKQNNLLEQWHETSRNGQGHRICKKVQGRSKYFQGTYVRKHLHNISCEETNRKCAAGYCNFRITKKEKTVGH